MSSTKTFKGPMDEDYLKTDTFGVSSTVWSPCGAEGMLNINSAIQLSPLDSEKRALLTVNTLNSTAFIRWRRCRSGNQIPDGVKWWQWLKYFCLPALVRVDGSQVQADPVPAVEEVPQEVLSA